MATESLKNSYNKIKAQKVHIGDGLDEEQNAELVGEKIDEKFSKQNEGQVSIARKNLVESGKEKYPSPNDINRICTELISLVGYQDEQVMIYNAINSDNPCNINECIKKINVYPNREYLFDDISYIVKSIKSQRNFDAVAKLLKKYEKIDASGYVKLMEAFADRKTIIEKSIENVNLNYDVFVTYASEDLAAVKEIVDFLESKNGGSLRCFYAERNLPKDADNFWENIYNAIEHSKVLLFVSSENSRNNDNVLKEITWWGKQENTRNRVEYLLSDYDRELNAKEKTVKENFPNKWYERSEKDGLAKRIIQLVSDYNCRRTSVSLPKEREICETEELPVETASEASNENREKHDVATTLDDISKTQADGLDKYFTIDKNGAVRATEHLYASEENVDLILPYGVKEIATEAFQDCSSLTSITIPDSVTSISFFAFYGCSSLTNITIPDSVTSIDYYALFGCDSLQYNEYDNAYYLGNDTNKYLALIKAKDDYIMSCAIHENTKVIGDNAFFGCSGLTSIAIPDSVTSIGSCSFYDCSSLTSITIPDSVTSIGWGAFEDCSGLTSITFSGTKAQWIDIKEDWHDTGNYAVICTDGELKKS